MPWVPDNSLEQSIRGVALVTQTHLFPLFTSKKLKKCLKKKMPSGQQISFRC
jgi:hypothetical protein